MFKEKGNTKEEIKLPEGFIEGTGRNTTNFYRIIIEEVTVVKIPKKETVYYHKDTGKIISSYKYSYELKKEQEEQKNYIAVKKATGEYETNEHTKKILEQTKDDIDVSDIALYINRAK